jgi:DNA-binding LytR/AlgR family response regulator
MNCIIIEDQPPAQRILIKYINDIGSLELLGTFNDDLLALEFLKKNSVDLIFLDVHLPKISGIDFLKSTPLSSMVILTTAFPNFALESYDLNVVDYLLKPFSFPRFVKAVTKASGTSDQKSKEAADTLFIKSGHEFVKVFVGDIVYINSDGDYTELIFEKNKILSSESLKHWENELKDFDFIRVHKSFLINFAKVKKIRTTSVLMDDLSKVPIGRAYKDVVTERMKK